MKITTLTAINFLLVVMCAMTAHAEAEKYTSLLTGKTYTKGESKYDIDKMKERDVRILTKTGGFIPVPAKGPLALVVDSRKRPTDVADELARVYKMACHLEMNVEKKERKDDSPLSFARSRMIKKNAFFIVVIFDRESDLPALSVYPEERIGLVNADKLGAKCDVATRETRISKELWRAIGFISGMGFSQMEKDIMQPIYSLADLDANNYPFIQPMNMMKMQRMADYFGVTKATRIPYAKAAQEGWALPPTNDYQKAIWDKVHAIPDKPMKVKFDPAAQKGKVTK